MAWADQGNGHELQQLERHDESTDDLGDERNPFLGPPSPSENLHEGTRKVDLEKPGSVAAARERCRRWFWPSFLLFLILVSGLSFGLMGWSTNLRPSTSHQSTAPPGTETVQDEAPATPRLRDEKEYVLSPSWDFQASPTTRHYQWTISDQVLDPDGVPRPMILINNQFPGPLVEANEGDTIEVHVLNQASNATSIHFHGLFQNGTNAMDATVGVTGCAIAPNSSHTYRFSIKGQSGTYWYHAHHSAQASDGLLGPVVIHAPNERTDLQILQYTSDRVVMVQDHYHNTTAELLMDYLRPDRENEEPVPDGALINGRGVREITPLSVFPTFQLAAGQKHRLRFINVGAFAEFQIEVDEHPFYITEVDGTDVRPEPFHRLNILPAQRYSVVLETNVTTADSFWLRARMLTTCFRRKNDNLVPEVRGILRYVTGNEECLEDAEEDLDTPTSTAWGEAVEVICRDLNTTALHPVLAQTPPPASDYVLLRANFMIGDWRLARGFFNGSTWHGNLTSPSLHRFLDAAGSPDISPDPSADISPWSINTDVFDRSHDFVLQTTGIQTLDIAINNFDDGAHPFHLHGHKFFVLTPSLKGYPPKPAELADYLRKNKALDNPLLRDTVTVAGYGWLIIRVVLDNPGMWAFHCHNAWHAEAGMFMQVLARREVVGGWRVGEEERELCGRTGVEMGVRPPDSLWFGDFGGG